MTDTDHFFQSENLTAALTDYEHATMASAHLVRDLLSVTVSSSGSMATTVQDLRSQIAPRLRHRDRSVGVITAPAVDAEVDIFVSAHAAAARFALRSAIRLVHDLEFTPDAEIAIGEMAVAALRSVQSDLSHLAFRIAEADHVETVRAALTLGRQVRVPRNFVVRCAVLGLGEALNAEHDPDASTSIAVETWLAEQRAARRQHR